MDAPREPAPLFDEAMLVLWGPIGWHARVRLFPDRLEAEPTSTLERLAGAAPFRMALGTGGEIDVRSSGQVLTVTAGDHVRKLSGKGAARLAALLLELRRPADGALAPDLRLLTGAVQRLLPSGRSLAAELRLGTAALQLVDPGGAEVLLLPLLELAAVERQPESDQLRLLTTRGEEHLLHGEIVGGLYVALRAMGFEGSRQPTEVVAPLWLGGATLQSGTIPRLGTLGIGPGGVFFVDQTLGASLNPEPYQQVALGAVLSVEVSTARVPVLTVGAISGEPLRFALSRRGPTIDDLAALLLERGSAMSAAWGGVRNRQVDARLMLTGAGLERLVADCEAQIAVGRPIEGACCFLRDGQSLNRGWIALLSTGLLFAPADARVEKRLFLDRARFDPARSGLEGERALRLVEGHRSRMAYLPQSLALVQHLWQIISDAKPGVAALRSRYPHLDRLTGPADQLRVADQDVELLAARDVAVSVDDEGLALVLGEALPSMFVPGLRLRVELTQQKTIFGFKALLIRVDRRVGAGGRLILSAPEALTERENSREAFRVTFLGQGSVTPLRGIADRRAAGAAQPAELSDLSFTGVGLRVPEDRSYPLRAVLRLRLPLGGRSRDELLAEVVHTRDAPDGMVHHGCRFLDPTAALHRDLQSKVIRLQQEEVVRRQEEAEASRTGNPSPAHGAPGHPGPARDEDATTRLGDRDEAAPGKAPRPHAEDPARPAAPAAANASNKMRSDDATVMVSAVPDRRRPAAGEPGGPKKG
jgi:hypothetical protein